MSKILVIDDEDKICYAFEELLKEEGHDPLVASNADEGIAMIKEENPDVVFMDIRMPGTSGLEALKKLRLQYSNIKVILMTAYGTMQTTIEAMQSGAFDYITKPLDINVVKRVLQKALNAKKLEETKDLQITEIPEDYQLQNIVGKSISMQDTYKLIGLVTTNNVPVLIQGESGVGKELVAKAIHYNSHRKDQPFVTVNLSTLPENLVETELFGHEKGAFTGAVESRQGKFEAAGEGTIFLDEIGDLPLSLQVKLLRVLQERSFEKVGSNFTITSQARILSASNKNLEEEIEKNMFRDDLYYRLKVITISLPPLRERGEDIPDLVTHFLAKINHDSGRNIRGVDQRALKILKDYQWPGNVRELENVIRRAVVLTRGDFIGLDNLPDEVMSGKKSGEVSIGLKNYIKMMMHQQKEEKNVQKNEPLFSNVIKSMEKIMILEALSMASNNQVKAAKLLGINRTTLRKKITDYDI